MLQGEKKPLLRQSDEEQGKLYTRFARAAPREQRGVSSVNTDVVRQLTRQEPVCTRGATAQPPPRGLLHTKGLNSFFFFSLKNPKNNNNKKPKPTILGILRAKKAWTASKHQLLYCFRSQPLRLVFRCCFPLGCCAVPCRDSSGGLRAQVLEQRHWSTDIPRAQTPRAACKMTLYQRVQWHGDCGSLLVCVSAVQS